MLKFQTNNFISNWIGFLWMKNEIILKSIENRLMSSMISNYIIYPDDSQEVRGTAFQ